jgi:hypothetical protein
MFSPEKFRSHFSNHNDFAKVSKFEVRIQPPKGASDMATFAADLRFQCEAAELPGYNINTVDNRIYGVPNPVAASATFGDITLTFMCAGDMWEKKFFDRWMDIIVPINNYNPRYKDDYASPKIEINQYSEIVEDVSAAVNQAENTILAEPTAASQLKYSALLFGAFPVAIAPLGLNWADDGFLKLAVTFKYEYWVPFAGNSNVNATVQPPEAKPNGSDIQKSIQNNVTPRSNPMGPVPRDFRGQGGKFGGGGASGGW